MTIQEWTYASREEPRGDQIVSEKELAATLARGKEDAERIRNDFFLGN